MWLRTTISDGPVLDRLAWRSALEGVDVVGFLAQLLHVPSVGLEALAVSSEKRQLGLTVDRDVVVVVDADQPAEPEMAGQRSRFVADALLEAAVAGDHERVVVAQPRPRIGSAAPARPPPSPPRCRSWPRGPVVTSTPAVWCTSGWPGVRNPRAGTP